MEALIITITIRNPDLLIRALHTGRISTYKLIFQNGSRPPEESGEMEFRLGPLMERKKTGKPSRYRSLIFLMMEKTDEAYESDAFNKVDRWKLFVERTTLAF